MSAREVILRETVVASPPCCPEIRLHLVTDACSLWRATERDLEAMGLPPPFWAFAWAGGQALARFVLDHPETVARKRVLDLGAGSGLVGIAAMRAGAAEVVASDIDPFAVAAIDLNLELNAPVTCPFRTTTRDLVGGPPTAEVILAGDVAYAREEAERIVAWLGTMAAAGVEVFAGDPSRGFLASAAARHLADYDAPADVDVGGRILRRTGVFAISPSR